MITIRVDHYFHADSDVVSLLKAIQQQNEVIMTNQADATQKLTDVGTKLDNIATEVGKVSSETQALQAEVAALTQAAQNADISPELQAAIDAVATRVDSVAAGVKAVDDLVPDAAAPPADSGT